MHPKSVTLFIQTDAGDLLALIHVSEANAAIRRR